MTIRVLLALTALGLFAALLGPVHTQEPGEPMVLSGRFELPSGDPAIGVKLELEVFRRVPRETERLSVVSDAQGRFELSVAPGREFSRLEARLAEHATVRWNWSELAGEHVDLGTVPLARAGVVVGRIVDAAGEFPGGTWLVGLQRMGQLGGWPPPDHVMAEAGTGFFRLEALHPGPVWVRASMWSFKARAGSA